MKQLAYVSAACGLLAVLGLAGCSGGAPPRPKTFPVTGTVMWKGAPVEDAQVTLVPTKEGQQAATGVTDAAGKFSVGTFEAKDGALEGEYMVKVVKYNIKPPQAGTNVQLSHEEEQKIYVEETKPAEPLKNLLPEKYENPTTSGLKHTVTSGPSTLDITIPEG